MLSFPCVLKDVCISVNCIMANQLIFSTEQRVFIYDQYLLTHSASQGRRLFETLSTVHNLYNIFQATGSDFYLWSRLKNAVYKTNPCTLEELKCNIRDKINNINRGELQRVMGNFIKRCQKCLDNEGGQFQHLRQ